MNKPVILIISPAVTVKGGISTVINNLLRSPLRNQFEFKIVATHVDGNRLKKIFQLMIGLSQSTYLFLFTRIDLVYIHGSDIISSYRKSFFFNLAKLFKKKIIYHFHGASFCDQYKQAPVFVQKRIRNFFEGCHITICLSQQWRDQIKKIAPNANLAIVYNGVFLPNKNCQKIRNKTQFNLCFLGLIGERKGIFDLINAMPYIVENFTSVNLFIGGNGDILQLKQTVKNLKLHKHIHYLGWVTGDTKEKILKQTDIFILPSYGEGLPMSILEAMSYGIPIIATDVGGIPEVVLNDKTGILIPPGDIDRLKDAILYLLKNNQKRTSMGYNARMLIESKFNVFYQATKLSNIFTNVLTNNNNEK